MDEVRYIISDAAKILDVETHALRYWEEELDLKIPRNEMGHRYYREEEIKLLEKIKLLKDKGYQLKAIKQEIEGEVTVKEEKKAVSVVAEMSSTEKMRQFKMIMGEIIEEAIKNNNEELCQTMGETVSDKVLKQMDYLARTKEEKDEERFRRFDEAVREIQKSRQEAAATENNKEKGKEKGKEKKKRGFFRR